MSDKTAIEIDDNGTAFFIKFGGGGYLQRKERLSFTEPDLSVHEHAICELAAEVRRLREEVAKLADQRNEGRELVSALSNEGGAEIARLRVREAKTREILQAHADEYERTDTDDGVLRAAERLGIWMASKRWLEAE